MPPIDLAFRVKGTTASVDHRYPLYSSTNRLVPVLHEALEATMASFLM